MIAIFRNLARGRELLARIEAHYCEVRIRALAYSAISQ
jgi:hypothetical protein